MSETNGAMQGDNPPQLNVLVQYIKDISFENPHAPASLIEQSAPPDISIQVNVAADVRSENEYEVVLHIEGEARADNRSLFKFELQYGGLFRLLNIPPNELQPVVLIECPRLLFPFARQIIAESVRNGGFPPLYLDPIDFVALYQQQMAAHAQPQQA